MTADLFVLIVAFSFGACTGSFLNVCIWRLPRRCLSVKEPRGSFCPSCRTPIKGHHNIPLVSWILLRGRCAYCGATIRFRYFLVELLTAVLFTLAAWLRLLEPAAPLHWTDFVALSFDIYLVGCVVVLSFVDLDLHIIPDEISWPTIALGLIAGALAPTHGLLLRAPAVFGSPHLDGLVAAILGMALGGGSLWVLGKVGEWVFKKPAMGMGDVKIMAGMGAFIGWDGCVLAILGASLLGSVLSGVRFFATRSHHLAFGPYLAVSALAVRFLGTRVDEGMHGFVRWLPGNLVWVWSGMAVLVVYLLVVLVAIRRDDRSRSAETPA